MNEIAIEICIGTSRFYSCGWADDGTGLEIVVEPWIEGFLPTLKDHLRSCGHCGSKSENNLVVNGSNLPCKNMDDVCFLNGDCSEKEDSMEKKEIEIQSETSKLDLALDVWDIASKFGLHILSREQLNGLALRSCAFPLDSKLSVPVQPPSYLNILYEESVDEKNAATSDIIKMKLDTLKTLTQHDSVKTTLEATLQCLDDDDFVDYLPGDSFGIIVKNPISEVELLLSLLRLADLADKTYRLTVEENTKKKNASVPTYIPAISTLRYVFENCVDFRSVPKKPLLRILVEYTEDPAEKRRLKELVSKEGSSEYYRFVRELNLTLLDMLIIFQSCKPPVTALLEHLPQLQARPYSVISSPLCDPKKISFAFNIIEIQQGEAVTFSRRGICTGWLASFLNPSNKTEEHLSDDLRNLTLEDSKGDIIVNVFRRNNQIFHLPKESATPIVMVGPGTGVAPYIGFLRHRQRMMAVSGNEEFGESWLFFGCRHRDKDYLYREDLEKFEGDKVLSHLIVSFSRDEESSGSKYVQDNIRVHGSSLVPLIVDKKAIIYVCGDAKNMAKDVFEAFVSVLELNKQMSTVEARKYIAQMQIDKRYLQDVWA